MWLFKNKPKITTPVPDLKKDPTTIEIEKIKHRAHDDLDAANDRVEDFKKRVSVTNHFTVRIHKAAGGR